MKSQWKILVITAVVLVGGFFAASRFYKQTQERKNLAMRDQNQSVLLRFESPSKGPTDAPVTIVEFLDPQCEACAAFHQNVNNIFQDYPDKLRLIIRYMPYHQHSLYAARILEVMKKRGRFWETLELFFARQREWGGHHDAKPELLLDYVKELGVDPTEIESSLKDFVYESRVKQDAADGQELGVTGTPTFFINGVKLDSLSEPAIRERIQEELS